MKLKAGMLLLCAASACLPQTRPAERPLRQAARGLRGAVAAGTDFATDAGMRLFHSGGNAVDAGGAAMFAAAVSEYSHFGFGGEAPILIRATDGRVYSIAGVGPMPKAATSEFFRNRPLKPGEVRRREPGGLSGIIPAAGLMPALVPGMVDAALLALQQFGTRSFSEAAAPAIELAGGMPLDETRAGAIARSREFLEMWPDSKRVFLPEGGPPAPGRIFRQTGLARTLRSMAEAEDRARAAGRERAGGIQAVRGCFYRGEIARRIGAYSRDNGGLLRYEDMAAFRLKVEEPVSATCRGYQVHKPGFWSQGPAMIETLNLLEGYDLRAMGQGSPEYVHTVAEALKLAYADRDTYYGDPAFVPAPAARLLAKDYAAGRRALTGPRASLEFRPGRAGGSPALHPSQSEPARARIDEAVHARDTTCVDAMDSEGTAFSATPSGAWLPSVIAGGTGIPLTQRAQSFFLISGHPNELAGGKRPRITLSPTLVTRLGRPYLALSTPGGDNQDQSLLQVLLNVVEFGMNAQEAVEAPRFQTRHLVSSFDNHAMKPGDLLLDERFAAAVFGELAARGHKVGTRPRWASGAAPVLIRLTPEGVIEAGADPYGHRSARAW